LPQRRRERGPGVARNPREECHQSRQRDTRVTRKKFAEDREKLFRDFFIKEHFSALYAVNIFVFRKMFAVTRCRRGVCGCPAARGGAKQGMAFLVSLVSLGVLVVALILPAARGGAKQGMAFLVSWCSLVSWWSP
jgi:hypothetical protein